jgi:hypothetical protein
LWIAEIKAVGAVARWLWNNAFQPAFKLILNVIGVLMSVWSKMLSALGHLPGFGWAKDAAKAMGEAADKAHTLADNIRDIPGSKRIDVNVYTHHIGVHGQDNIDLVSRSGGGSASLLLSGTSRSSTSTVNINVTAPVGADAYTIGEELKGYLDTYVNGVPA